MNNVNLRKLIILDFFLGGKKGHDEQYDFSVAEEAVIEGINTEIWCYPRGIPSQPEFVKERLKLPLSGGRGFVKKFIAVILRCMVLRQLFESKELNENTILLIPTIDNHFIPAFFLGAFGKKIRPKVLIIIRRSLSDNCGPNCFFTSKLKILINEPLMKYLNKSKNISFVSDSELISDELKEKGFKKVFTLPIPHLPLPEKNSTKKDKIVIGYFGGARYEKGFDMLPETVENCLKKNKGVSFILQSYLYESSELMKMAHHRLCELEKKYPENIEMVDRYLTNDEYNGYMKKCSVILFPYRKQFYGKGTSGILSEAISNGVWAIVPSGTWMSEQKKRYGKIIGFNELTDKEIIDSINKCIENENKISDKNITEQISKWYCFHSPENYIKILRTAVYGDAMD